jgi:protein TonB
VLSTPPVVATPAVPPPPAGEARDGRAGAGDAGSAPAGPRVAAVPPSTGPEAPDLRSALRRGAGGSGEGRGGVEGEPIPLDSADPKYNDYLEQVRRKIKANWGFPCLPVGGNRRCEYKTTHLVVEFGIAKDGRVPFVVVRNSSGYPIYDDYAVNAIKFSSPFPPVPDSVSRTGFPINATFRYVVESSLTNLLR